MLLNHVILEDLEYFFHALEEAIGQCDVLEVGSEAQRLERYCDLSELLQLELRLAGEVGAHAGWQDHTFSLRRKRRLFYTTNLIKVLNLSGRLL